MREWENYDSDCVCSDLENWPNHEIPYPHSPIDNSHPLTKIHSRLSRHRV